MLDTFYLPSKSPDLVNFPILRSQHANIQALLTYALRVGSALSDYNEARYDRVDLNMDELQTNVQLCRDTAFALGMADSVPYDILVELRKLQEQLQNILYIYRVQGRLVIGTPTTATTGGGI